MQRIAWIGAALALSACGQRAAPGAGAGAAGQGRPVAVVTTTVATRPWVDAIEALGTTKANESVTLTAKVTETVDRVAFDDGDFAEAGQVLVDLSGRAEVASLEEARAAFKEAQQQYDRQSGLVQQGTIARSQLDTQVALRDAARARMEAIRARLADRVITAPFSGVLGFRQVSPGTLVTPGTVITTIDDVSTIKLDFSVPETFLAALEPEQEIGATSVAFPGRAFRGAVSSIDSRVDPVTRAVIVRAMIPNPDNALRPGMLLSVRLNQRPRDALAIPELALVQVGADSFVYRVMDDSTIEQARVVTGARRRGEVEVVEGLAAGDRIVVEGTVKLRPGAKVVPVAAADAQPAATASE
jgi:membrane fusion protein (multidrug efflux system)